MGIYLNPGNEKFAMSVQSEIYVDKTGMIAKINKLINTEQRYVCISRPRRFGKSMTANMLTAFYGKGCDSLPLFKNFKIANFEGYQTYLNQCNVIAINVQELLGLVESIDELLCLFQKLILKDLKREYKDLLESEDILWIALADVYSEYRDKFIFIIDEWDCVLRDKRYSQKDYKKYLDFLEVLLKDKAYVSLAYMTGILPIKKYGKHSALNMFIELSMTAPSDFAQYIGFTEQEVQNLCKSHGMNFDLISEWYDGYRFDNNIHIYNPKSVVESILRREISNYWTQTETYEALRLYIDMDYKELKQSIVDMVGNVRIKIDTGTFQNDMSSFQTKDDVLTLLIHLGYLAYEADTREVYIPNSEIKEEFIRAIKGSQWNEVMRAIEQSEKLLQATWDMDEQEVARQIDICHRENVSILEYNNENALSCVITLAYYNARNEYQIIREMPAGKGYADLVFLPKKKSDKPAMLVELKWNKSADTALKQIKEKSYVGCLENYPKDILLVGIDYDKETKQHKCRIERVQL